MVRDRFLNEELVVGERTDVELGLESVSAALERVPQIEIDNSIWFSMRKDADWTLNGDGNDVVA